MRALLIYCHPRAESFTAAVRDRIIERLEAAGAEVRVRDLCADGFDPRLTASELERYEDCVRNRDGIEADAADLRWCDTLIFVYPTWWYGLPATLKGWLDRVLVPGVAFHMPDQNGNIKPALTHISRLGVFTTCGASRWLTWWVGAPGRRTLMRGLRILCAPRCRMAFAAHYLMDSSTSESRAAHLDRVSARVDKWTGHPARAQEAPA
ncbi:MAG: NAD(P)H-dependent oxidoreductase [Pseudomonadota bacterium]